MEFENPNFWLYLVGVRCPKVEGDESQPDDAGGVHGEADILGFIEVLWHLSRFDGVNCADCDEDHAVHLDTVNN